MFEDQIVTLARQWIGTPYRHRSATLGAGCDCLGLLRGVWRMLYGAEADMAVPPYRADMRDPENAGALEGAARALLRVVTATPRPGHVLLFRLHRSLAARHCGILISPTRFIHAQEQIGVVEANLGESWSRRIAGVYAFPAKPDPRQGATPAQIIQHAHEVQAWPH